MKPEGRILAVFERRPIDRIPWNIRHECWYFTRKAEGTLPPKYENLNLAEVCADLGASWRCYSGYFVENAVKVSFNGDVKITHRTESRFSITSIKTPYGTLRTIYKRDDLGITRRVMEYPIKKLDDFKPLEYLLENVNVTFNFEVYRHLKKIVGGNGIVSYFFPRTPLQALFFNYMGITRTIKFLFRYKDEVEKLMEQIRYYNDNFYKVIAPTPIKILNLGENIDSRITSPRLFKKYCLPRYQERSSYLHKKGKFVHIHIDGYAKPILPLLKETGLDGVEALTPKPVGDFTLQDLKKTIGDDIILVDGIPYILFLPSIEIKHLEKFVRRIVSMFPENLVLGISDELPPPSDYRRIRRVSEIIDEIFK
ncbi:TPA: hypothetical protein EYP70_03880 [Candidatus Bathyarchaeota archaeon]|nr:hypothetical protein [Candidatus Bathyarchaeota archaeon]